MSSIPLELQTKINPLFPELLLGVVFHLRNRKVTSTDAKRLTEEKTAFLANGAGETGYLCVKE